MASTRTLLIALLVGCFVVVGFAHTDPAEVNNICLAENGHVCGEAAPSHDRSALSRLIHSASPDALHKFLHTVTGFQHGVFDSDEAAVEAVLEHNPTLSSTVAQLQRRQNSTTTDIPPPPVASPTISSTTTTTTQETTPSAVTSTTTTTPVEQPSTTQTTVATPTLPTTTTEPTTAPTSTTTPTQPTSTEQVPTTAPTTPTAPTAPTTPAAPTAPTTTDTTIPTTQGTPTTNKPVTTPKTNTLTSTLPGGAVTTMVSIVWVTPGVSETPTKSNTADASLQSGVAVAGRRSSKLEVFVGGAVAIVGGAMLV